jgi:hypothetical protein
MVAELSLIANSADSAPIVLEELSATEAGQLFTALPISVPFDFRIYEPNVFPTPVYFTWFENYSAADIGKSFLAPQNVVDGAIAAFPSPTALYVLQTGGPFFTEPFRWTFVGLPLGYQITAIERVIDEIVLTPISEDRYFVNAAQTIRIWGEPIPEPGTISFSLIAWSYVALIHRTAGRRRPKSRLYCRSSPVAN